MDEAQVKFKRRYTGNSGYLNEKNVFKKTHELETWLRANNLQVKTGFVSAQYNPPWIPGFMRRNEIIAELD